MQSGEALQAGEGGSPGGTGEDGFADGEGWPDSDARASGEVGSSPPLCLYGVPLREVIEIIRANSDDDMALGFCVSTDDGKYENAPILPPSCCGEVEFCIEDDKNSQRGISLKVNGRGPYALDTSEEFAAAVAGGLSGFSQRSKKARAVAQGSSGPFIGRRRRSEPFVIKGASWRSASESRRPDCESASTDGDVFGQQMPFGLDEVPGRAEEEHPRYVTCGSFVRALQRAEQSYPGLGLSEARFEGVLRLESSV